jgi:glycosyltransferase involved in cell wall biosynthesis
VSFRGFLSFEEVVDLYRSADLLLNARLTKAMDTRYFFPSKLMELLASGTPVLSTCTGHVEAEYGHVLYLLREETPEALAARIQEIRAIDPAERRGLGARARDFMLREKTWDRQGERLARYIREDVLGMTSPHA